MTAPNVLDRQFQADAPNQKWVADFTYIPTREGWLYLAVVLDLYSRMVVGWSMQRHMSTELVSDVMTMALWRRRPTAVLQHSDQGSQYANEIYQLLLSDNVLTAESSPVTGTKAPGERRWRAAQCDLPQKMRRPAVFHDEEIPAHHR